MTLDVILLFCTFDWFADDRIERNKIELGRNSVLSLYNRKKIGRAARIGAI